MCKLRLSPTIFDHTYKKEAELFLNSASFFVLAKVAPPTHYVDIPNGNLRAIKSSRLALLKKVYGT